MNNKIILWILTFLMLASIGYADTSTNIIIDVTWDNDNLSGSNPLDIAGSAFTFTNNGATTGATGKINEAFTYVTNDYIASNAEVLPTSQDYSIAVWFKTNAIGSAQAIVNQWAPTGNGYDNYRIEITTAGKIFFQLNDNIGYKTISASNITLSADTWYFLVLTNDYGGNALLYIDNVLEETIAVTSYAYGERNDPLNIGRMPTGGGSNYYNGYIDDIILYQKILTVDDIAELWNDGDGYNPLLPQPAPATENLTITVLDAFTGNPINNVSAFFYPECPIAPCVIDDFYNFTGNVIHTTRAINSSILQYRIAVGDNPDNYFTTNYYNYNMSTNLIAYLNQSAISFNVFNIFNESVSVFNITIDGNTHDQDYVFPLSSDNYTVQFSSNDYTPINIQIEVLPLDAKTYNFTGVYDAVLNLSATESVFGNDIDNFIVQLSNDEYNYVYDNTSVGFTIQIPLIKDKYYNITTSKANYLSNTSTLLVNTANQNYNVKMFALNDIIINFYDEITLNPVLDVTFYLFSNVFSGTYTTTTGQAILDSIPSTTYEIRYGINSTTLAERSYYLIVPILNTSDSNISLYTINTSIGFQFIRRIVDQNSIPLTNYILEIQRPYPSDDNTSVIYRSVERALIDSTGDAVFTAVPNTQAYRFRVLDNFSIVKIFSPTFLVETTKELIVDDAQAVGQSFNEFFGISSTLIFNDTSSYFIMDYNDAEQVASEVCLVATRTYLATSTVTTQCSSDPSGTLLIYANQSLNGSFIVVGTATINENTFTIETLPKSFNDLNSYVDFSGVGLLIYILLIIFAGTMTGYTNIIYPIGFIILGTLAFSLSFLGMVALSATLMGGVLVLGILILVLAKK